MAKSSVLNNANVKEFEVFTQIFASMSYEVFRNVGTSPKND